MARKNGLEFITEAVALVLTIAALVLFCLSYTTGYYTFGQMQSGNGAYTYEGGTLTITNAEGGVVTAQGDPLKFHYITTVSDQLTGDFTVPAADLRQ